MDEWLIKGFSGLIKLIQQSNNPALQKQVAMMLLEPLKECLGPSSSKETDEQLLLMCMGMATLLQTRIHLGPISEKLFTPAVSAYIKQLEELCSSKHGSDFTRK